MELERHTPDSHGFVDYFMERYQDTVRYARDIDRFFIYDGQRWVPGNQRHVEMKSLVQQVCGELARGAEGDVAKAVAKLGRDSTGVNKLVSSLQNDQRIWAVSRDFSARPELVNFADCTLDVHRPRLDADGEYDLYGNVTQHKATDMLDSILPVQYEPGLEGQLKTPLWDKLMNHMCGNSRQLRDNLEDAMAYGLYGANPEQFIVFLVGEPNIGKTQVLELMVEFAGSLGGFGKIELITTTRGGFGEHDSLRSALRGRRFVMLGEANAKIKLDEGKLKDLTGSAWVPTRELGKEQVDTRVTWTLYAATNELPALPSTMDDAVARRMWIFDLPGKQVGARDRDTDLTRKILLTEKEAIINMLAGRLQRMFINGRCTVKRSALCIKALDNYRADYDTTGEFCKERVLVDEDNWVSYNDLHEAYLQYCRKHAYAAESKRKFIRRVEEVMMCERDSAHSRMRGISLAYESPVYSQ